MCSDFVTEDRIEAEDDAQVGGLSCRNPNQEKYREMKTMGDRYRPWKISPGSQRQESRGLWGYC